MEELLYMSIVNEYCMQLDIVELETIHVKLYLNGQWYSEDALERPILTAIRL